MTIFRSEETLVGIVALAVVPWIAWTLRRGLRDGRLPIFRSYVDRSERPTAFGVLFIFFVGAAVLMTFIAFDLLVRVPA
jgi:hypothetical protein